MKGLPALWNGFPRETKISLEVRVGLAAGPFMSQLQSNSVVGVTNP
jgi:hypothetical protein